MDGSRSSMVNGDGVERRKDGGCSSSLVSSQHKRSKSASDRNLDSAKQGVLHSTGKDRNVSQKLQNLMRQNGAETLAHHNSSDAINEVSSNPRASLENDIEQLQMRLQQEKSMRIMLERAMGRASSTLSPGHRHFAAQTRELIAEIELLEEEVANREQHVLSLYRSIFEQCLSGAPSQQSSVVTSPAHTKNEVRKHPSIISSAFCSSKKFPLQPFQVLSSGKDSGKKKASLQSKTKHASLLGGKSNIHIDGNCLDPMKFHGKAPSAEKSSLACTLKDHLYQCPSKLSEELVRCMAAIYCWVRSAASTKPDKGHSPLLSRSSTNVVQPRRSIGDDHDWSCRSVLEISSISTDRNQYSRASYAISNYRILVEQLERVSAGQMEDDAKVAFWINVYNSLVMHAYLAYGIPNSSLRRMALFHKAAYNIGGHVISANSIEHSILCCRTPRTGRWYETILSTAMRKKSGEEKQLIGLGFGLSKSQPFVCFALCSGTSSDPMLRVYTSTNIKEELETAKRDYLQGNVVVHKSRKVFLPKILERFSKDASISLENLLSWVSKSVDRKLQEAIQKCIESKSKGKASHIMEWLPYDTRFRYVFASELTEKPWWV
ncbi:uncharacterized protein LOC131248259 isoform X2 [Magnolia sinica]|uniref:uncharacterized protein LOC131248259 isoform X2 n=1 Tax=Magnolia sinica TaxID=86752 RepID=UPI00265A88C5|nr:uncharacterized protein LOC131248259 isoform X2 [Magnolia sinica]